jgi:hypothetical protein
MLQITAKIKHINDTEVISDKYKKRTFVVTTSDKYPQDVQFQCSQDKCDMLNGYKAGQDVTISFNLRGREYNGKYYNTLEAWKVSFAEAAPQEPQSLNDLF